MGAVQSSPTKRETLTLRIKAEDGGLIDRAAKAVGKNRSDFVLSAALAAAEAALQNQSVFQVNRKVYAAFLSRLDMPPASNAVLRKTMQTNPPWEGE